MLANTRIVPVAFGDCDPSGIVYNPHYFVWFDLSVHALLERGGLSLKGLMSDFGIDGIPVVEYKARFLAPARWGDRLTIETAVTGLHRSAFDIQHRVLNNGVLAVDCNETRVCTALDPGEGRVRARPLPEPVVEILRAASEKGMRTNDS